MARGASRFPQVQRHLEAELARKGVTRVAGIDEAGRGPLAGPVVAAAVILPPPWSLPGLDDSKRLPARARERLYELIHRAAVAIGVGVAEPGEIDRLNIHRATLQAMARAVAQLHAAPQYLMVDGRHAPPLPLPCQTVVDGDACVASIAAASIIAKVTRDRLMAAYHHDYPQFNFLRNKGYATREHREAIRRFGLCPIHRRSFAPQRTLWDR
ncbi:MAG: ribonuclease HII [Deltaproteobacteria bacterium]|nr:ribonuclease HII [Deltaproteobacteria bacterium]MBI3079585.1 ribonuclease HII [Deltaproteobacteria bacterium]